VGSATSGTSRRNVRNRKPCAGCVSHLACALTYMNHLHVHQPVFAFQLHRYKLPSLMRSFFSLLSLFLDYFISFPAFICFVFSPFSFFTFLALFIYAFPNRLLSFCFILISFLSLSLFLRFNSYLLYTLHSCVLSIFIFLAFPPLVLLLNERV
jgi:hypothetical protein